MTLRRSALLYGARGLKVFPVKPFCKSPPLVRWGTRSTSDQATIQNWWQRQPAANVGLACGQSGIAVLDIDVKDNRRGQTTLDLLELEEGLRLSPTRMQRTPSGGIHYFYRGEIPTTQNVIGRHLWSDGISHIDTRGIGGAGGGYVLLPPSQIAKVGRYEWLNKLSLAPIDQWVVDLFTDYSRRIGLNFAPQESDIELDQPGNLEWFRKHLEEDAPAATEGQGGELCTLLLAGLAKDHGISEDVALEMIFQSSWNRRCDPPWDFDELKVKIHNAYSYLVQTQPGASTAWADFKDDPPPAVSAPPHLKKNQTRIRARGKQYAAEKAAARKAGHGERSI